MFKNFIKTTIRNLANHKTSTFINIIGLAIGITSCLFILIFIHHEMTYDNFHEHGDNIYLMGFQYYVGPNQYDFAIGPVPLAEAMKQEFPEVKQVTRIFSRGHREIPVYVKYQDKQFREDRFVFADSTVFEVFTLPLLAGSPKTALRNPNSVVITPAMTKKYFGDDNPMGKIIMLEDSTPFTVTGIAKPLPSNSHFEFDFLGTFINDPYYKSTDWYDVVVYTYLLLHDHADPATIEAKLPQLAKRHYEPVVRMLMGVSYEEFLKSGNLFGFTLEPLKDLHLRSQLSSFMKPKGNIQTVIILASIALLILIVACINFINLATARASQRANEVGIRKVVGSSRSLLIAQFMLESIIVCFIAVGIGIILVEFFLPLFNQLAGLELTSDLLLSPQFILMSLGLVFLIGTIAGSYPSLLLSSFRPVSVLRGKFYASRRGQFFRYGLVVFQFTASITLIIGTLVIQNQLHYLRSKDLGFDKEQVMVVRAAHKLGSQQKAFKQELLRNPNVVSASYSDCLPQLLLEIKPFQKEGAAGNEQHTMITMQTDYDFMDTYKPQLHQGRFLDLQYSTDTSAVLLNQAALKALDIQNPSNERIILGGRKPKRLHIIGVFEDFHFETLHKSIRPFAVMLGGKRPAPLLSIRLQPGSIRESLKSLEQTWRKFIPGQPMEYVFYDDEFEKVYQSEIHMGQIIRVFTILAILVACLGLLGLASFTAEQRIKEIGIRKVLGATVPGLVILLYKNISKWVLIALVIASPLAWYMMNKWLENFAYRIEISWWIFALAGGLALLVALATVSWQALRAATVNPVEALRYE